MKNFVFSLFLLTVTSCCLAQNLYVGRDTTANAYYATDSVLRSGIRITDQGLKLNSFSCSLIENGVTKEFSPYQVKEYGFNRKTVYLSRKITINNTQIQVFLLRLVAGRMSLYLYGGGNENVFVLEPEGESTRILPEKDIDGKNFKEQLQSLTADCEDVLKLINDLRYNRASLSQFIRSYNECRSEPLPRTEFGFSLSAGTISLINPVISPFPYVDKAGLKNCLTWSLGLFADHPIRYSNFSLHPQLLIAFISHDFSSTYLGSLYRNSLKLTTLNLPFSIRYYINAGRITPFISAGGLIAFNVGNDQTYAAYQPSPKNPAVMLLKESGEIGIKQFATGVTFGAGARFPVSSGRTIRFEIRYSRYFQRWQIISYGGNEFSVVLSFNMRKFSEKL